MFWGTPFTQSPQTDDLSSCNDISDRLFYECLYILGNTARGAQLDRSTAIEAVRRPLLKVPRYPIDCKGNIRAEKTMFARTGTASV